MLRKFSFLMLSILFVGGIANAQQKHVFGNWHGEFLDETWNTRTIRAEVVGLSQDTYKGVIYVAPEGGEEVRVFVGGKTQKGVTHFEGEVDLGSELGGAYQFIGDVVFTGKGRNIQSSFTGSLQKNGTVVTKFELNRVEIVPPTRDMKPPEGAIVLLENNDAPREAIDEAIDKNWVREYFWRSRYDGSYGPAGMSTRTKETFGSAQIHVEFWLDYMPTARGQGRSNSGCYVQGRYEIQILDSYTMDPADNLCGGIYQQAVPLINASLPPLEWQTYDITFHAPKFDEAGNKIKNAVMTVKHNGKVIHDNLELTKPTPGGSGGKEAPKGPLHFQYHGNDVRFKNVWIKPLSE